MMTRKNALVVTTILALFGAPSFSGSAFARQSADAPATLSAFEQRLAKLEAEVSALRQENRQLRSQIGAAAARAEEDAAVDASVAPSAAAETRAGEEAEVATKSSALAASSIQPIIKAAGGAQWLSVGGFIMAQAEAGGAVDARFGGLAANDRFYLRRARIVLGGHFAEDFDFKISAEMAGSLSGGSGMRGQLADGYISWTKYPALNITAGQFKTPYGHEFLSNDLAVYTIEHALVSDVLTLGRQIGAQAGGTFLKTRLNYTVGMFNGNGVNPNGINTNVNDNDQFLYAGRVSFVPVKTRMDALGWDATWNIGVNGYRSNDTQVAVPDRHQDSPALFAGRRTGWGVDTQITIGPWALWFEYLNTEFAPSAAGAAKTTADGWFLQGAWNIVPKQWQAVVRYETFDPDTDIAGSLTREWTFGVNYLIKGDDLKLMLDFITGDPRFRANNYQDEDRADRVLLRLQAVF